MISPRTAPTLPGQPVSFSGSRALALGISVLFVIVAGVLPFRPAGIFADVAKVVIGGI